MDKINLKYIFIDIDDTLLDFQAYVKYGLEKGFEEFCLGKYHEDVYNVFTETNTGLWHDIEKGKLDLEGLKKIRFNLIFDKLGISFNGVRFEMYFRKLLNESAIPVSGAMELLELLSKDYTICAASNGPSFQQRKRMEIGGMSKYIKYYFISEELGISKPAAQFFEAAFDIIRKDDPAVKTQECMFIGDSLSSDIEGGNNYGLITCLFDRNHKYDASTTDLTKRPDYIAHSLSEIPTIINNIK